MNHKTFRATYMMQKTSSVTYKIPSFLKNILVLFKNIKMHFEYHADSSYYF